MRLIEQLFRILAPHDCLKCGTEGSLICSWCIDDALPEVIPRCYRCNRLTPFAKTCSACRRHSPLKHVWVRSEYTDAARELVHIMKYKYSGVAADLIAKQLMNTLPAIDADTIVVHVPTATNHVRERGYDHARRIAHRLAPSLKFRHVALLARTTQIRQVGSGRKQRLEQMESSFRPLYPRMIQGAHILLVDDVITTGATIEAAARTLMQAGATTVDAVIFAQAR